MTKKFSQRSILRGLLFGAVTSGSMLGCSGPDTTGVPALRSTDPYAMLRLNVRAAVMSTVPPYDTLQLVPRAYTATGILMPNPGSVVYSVSDTTLQVSPTGLVTVRHPTGDNSFVVARIQDTVQNVTHVDTAYILATATGPAAPLQTFSIQVAAGDSAIQDVDQGAKQLPVTAIDANGDTIALAALRVSMVSSNPMVATVDTRTGVVSPVSLGTALITATTTYYGITKTDSLRMTIGYQDFNEITTEKNTVSFGPAVLANGFNFTNLVIAKGKSVLFDIPYEDFYEEGEIPSIIPTADDSSLDIIFDDSSNVQAAPDGVIAAFWRRLEMGATNGSGNVHIHLPSDSVAQYPLPTDGSFYNNNYLIRVCDTEQSPCAAMRSFPVAGTYHYHEATHGWTGTITVVDE